MKSVIFKFVSLLFVMQLLSACMYHYFPQQDTGKLMTYPIIPHKNEVEVYFGNEKPTDTAYLKLRVIDMYGGIYTSTGAMIEAMKKEAQKYGVDAILLLDDKAITEATTTSTGILWNRAQSYTQYENRRFMCALGIKYKRNISQVDNYIRKQQIALYDSATQTYKAILDVELELDGNAKKMKEIVPKTALYYDNFIKKYSLSWLIYDKSADWQTTSYDENINQKSQFDLVRVYSRDNWDKKLKVSYNYNGLQQIEKVRIKSPEKKPQFLKYVYLNPKTQKLNSLTVVENDKTIYKQVFEYDENQKLQHSLFYKIEEGKEIPFLKVTYIYYQKSDF
jgi:hypothetical protein